MTNYQEKIKLIMALIAEISREEDFLNEQDVRSVTLYGLYQCTENLLFALIQLNSFFTVGNLRTEIDPEINNNDVAIKKHNYEGFIISAYFNSFFVLIETHIRHIASHYENKKCKIEVTSIKATFENLTNPKYLLPFKCLNKQETEIFLFFCYLRNTMHNIGFHCDHHPIHSIIIHDLNSNISADKTELILKPGQANNFGFQKILLLNEQVFNLILKMNKLIPDVDVIKHRLDEIGFNN